MKKCIVENTITGATQEITEQEAIDLTNHPLIKGWRIVVTKDEEKPLAIPPVTAPVKLSTKELRQILRDNNIPFNSKAKEAELLALVKQIN